jgi:hypothetical protein
MKTEIGNQFTADIRKEENGATTISIHADFENSDELYDLRDHLLGKGVKAEVKSEFGRSNLNFEI